MTKWLWSHRNPCKWGLTKSTWPLGQGQWVRVTGRTGQSQCALLLESSVEFSAQCSKSAHFNMQAISSCPVLLARYLMDTAITIIHYGGSCPQNRSKKGKIKIHMMCVLWFRPHFHLISTRRVKASDSRILIANHNALQHRTEDKIRSKVHNLIKSREAFAIKAKIVRWAILDCTYQGKLIMQL